MKIENHFSRPNQRKYSRAAAWWMLGAWALASVSILMLQMHWQHHDAPVPKPPPKPIQTAQAQIGSVVQTIDAPGKLSLYRYVDVGTPLAGQVKEIHVSIGESVKQGKLLAEIEPLAETARADSNRAQLARLNADLADQKAQYEFAQLQFQRQTRLMEDKATREENVESSRMSMLSSAAKLDAIRAEIQQIETSMKEDDALRQQTKLLAPMAGTVVALFMHQGQAISAGQSALLRIADLSKMTVQARVAETDVTQLHKGMAAYFTTPGLPGRRWAGNLNQIMPLPVDDSAQQGKPTYYTVLFDAANPDHALMVGMNTEVKFVVTQVENAVTIPACLVGKTGTPGARTLMVEEANGKLSERKVEIGLSNAQLAQVESGLRAGERVVVTHRAGAPDCPPPETWLGHS